MGLLFRVSKLCGSKFQVAFRLQKQHFQVPALFSQSFVLPDARGNKWHESVHFTVFWGYILHRIRAQPVFVEALCMLTKFQWCRGVTALKLGRLLQPGLAQWIAVKLFIILINILTLNKHLYFMNL